MSGEYAGLLNLSEKPFTCTRAEVFKAIDGVCINSFSEDDVFAPIIDHCIIVDDTFTAERHTISIFKIEESN